MAFWHPVPQIDSEGLRRGLRAFQGDGICSQVRDSLLSGPLLVGYALLLGASNAGVGLLSALAPATDPPAPDGGADRAVADAQGDLLVGRVRRPAHLARHARIPWVVAD